MYSYFLFLSTISLLGIIDMLLNKLFVENANIKKVNFFKGISIIITTCFLGFRYANGWDYMAYFYTIKNYLVTNIVTRGEVLNIGLVNISQTLQSPFFYFMINAIIQVVLISYVLLQKSQNFWISLMLYITFPLFYLNSFSVVRMITAVTIVFFSYKFIEDNKFIRFSFFILIAYMFHQTALIALIFYPLSKIKFHKKNIILITFVSLFFKSFIGIVVEKFFPEYLVYLNGVGTGAVEGTKAVMVFIVIGVIIFLFDDYFKDKKYSIIFIFGVLIYLLFYGMGTISHRLSLYGTIFSLLLLPDILELMSLILGRKFRVLIYMILFAGFWLMFLYGVSIGRETFIPYNFYFNFN